MIISNAANYPINQTSGTVPDVAGALTDWFQAIQFTTIVKTVVDFQVVETPTVVQFQGVWQPQGPKQIAYKPEGQRAWNWFMLHAEPGLILQPDEVITYQSVQYRVRSQTDYRLYGYIQYELTEDYTGAGP